jgi:hypothetical protein
MFRQKNSNTKIENVEKTYGLDLNARGDMKLGTMLRRRGFDSQSPGAPLIAFFAMSGIRRPCPGWDFANFELAGGIDTRTGVSAPHGSRCTSPDFDRREKMRVCPLCDLSSG